MYRLPLLVAIGFLIVAGSASAAPFGELPFTPVTGSVSGLRATGAPGELVRSTDGARQPDEKVVMLRLRRVGQRIEVSRRTDVPAEPGDFGAIGTHTRSLDVLPIALTLGDGNRKRTRFRLDRRATVSVR